ncbi:protein translocase subunit SecF [Candidatus Woesearchaeota archaeon]|nr:MAG: protein translocase subunit SecF [Candidatus Woesearchaeota archaeon]
MRQIAELYKKKYKALLVIPAALLIISIILIIAQYARTGDFVYRDVTLKGGVTLTISTQESVDPVKFEKELTETLGFDNSVRVWSRAGAPVGYIIDSAIDTSNQEITEKQTDMLLEAVKEKFPGLTKDNYSIETIGSSLGASFFKQTFTALIIAFIFMGIVVFFYFRTFVPSAAVMLAAFSDIIVTLAIIDLLRIKLSTAGIAAFLMLIGYSVDTDILLTTRVVKRKIGTVYERVIGAMKTGLMMSATTLAAVITALLISDSEVLKQIMTILLIGLLIDFINTWIQNAGILRWYMEHKSGE